VDEPIRILVVDDDKFTRGYLPLILEEFGYEVSTADTGAAAIAAIHQFGVDVILLKIDLPDMDPPSFS
jgi:CheY-like chemotaxis protein